MAGHLQPIKLDSYKPLRELVCENIRQAIIDGTFSPGERLMEIQLADEMGVSRTPVREAIRKLELEGFVVMIPRRGTYVADISIKDITEIYEIRISLDVLAAGLAAERITDEELATLNNYMIEISKQVPSMNMEKIVELDTAFHNVLYTASRNERLVSIINNLREQLTGIRGRSMSYPGRLIETMDEHRALVDSIAARDPERAQRAARVHIENAEQTLMRSLERRKK
ncbi:MAG: GntR family transcriptional regulator [Phascolarctobacterium sp.]|nr:GntR family transcriptional regulator [Phascolarctobacterium sp.]